MKAIEFEVNERPMCEEVDKDGHYTFGVYTSNMCDDDLQNTIETLSHVWELNTEVTLTVKLKLRDLFTELYDNYQQPSDGTVDADSMPLFESLKNDCQWIVDQVNALKKSS